MIQINDVSIVYDHTIIAINHLTTTIHAPVTAIIGENGSGKSTLLTSIVGLHPMAGSILVDGIEVKKENLHTIRKRVGYLFQNPDHQLFMNTVYEDIAFGLVSQGMDQDVVKEKVEAMACQLHIDDLLARNCAKLSGGQKSLVALAGVLVMEPDILLLDEPTAFLDPKARRRIINILKSLPQSIILATHDLDMAYDLVDEVILIHKGMLITKGDKQMLTNKDILESNGLELPLRFQ
ncbi:energy-coupling factor ABC transporter ATP-binding protein [Sharpea azabuensis]|uniref:Cobalt/nickel transport system ATP-binding protein n=1 Tax=Sharpea azabuensis TaxID=322505 RepID=A0A1H6YCS4_9FIRM|nr:ABC transporter ATP-binding protein [Sharpea azabuensis]SEJ34992.1 cobalt/nickel transport system ATP-binding protein [Sharpea azabuensis]